MCGGVRTIAARSRCGRVARPHRRGDPRGGQTRHLRQLADPASRLRKVLVDVGAERFERRDVDDPYFVRERTVQPLDEQIVRRDQERGEGLARTGRGGDERVAVSTDRLPPTPLGRGRVTDLLGKPLLDERVE